MSIIETAYGQALAHIIGQREQELMRATEDYARTGDEHTTAATSLRIAQADYEALEAEARAAWLTDPELGTNDRQRAANLTVRMLDDLNLTAQREHLNSVRITHDEAERTHKNAYHRMESCRVAITGLASILRTH